MQNEPLPTTEGTLAGSNSPPPHVRPRLRRPTEQLAGRVPDPRVEGVFTAIAYDDGYLNEILPRSGEVRAVCP